MTHVVSAEKGTLIRELFRAIPTNLVSICDMGTGRTSLSLLMEVFPDIRIQAVTHPQDDRKISSIHQHIGEGKYDLILADLAIWTPESLFDLVLAHQFLGEATHHNTVVSFRMMVDQMFALSGQYVIVFDYVEDPGIEWEYVVLCAQKWGNIIMDKTYSRDEPFEGKRFTGATYRGILIEKADK